MSTVHKPWEAEHAVTVAQAARLIAEHLPALAGLEVIHAGRGWDVEVMRAGPYAIRFPRRGPAIPLVAAEIRALPGLGPRLPIATPLPLWSAGPVPDFPAPFYAHRWLEGTTADRAALDDGARAALAAPLGALLRALHAIDAPEAAALGLGPPSLRLSMDERSARARLRLEALAAAPAAAGVDRALAARVHAALAPAGRLYELVQSAAPARACAIHGDLYARHLLLDARGALAAVIDWGDVAIGDPAEDLALVYAFLPTAARAEFFAAYGPATEAELARARWSALSRYAGSLLAYSADVGDAPLLAEAQAAARFALGEG